MQELIPTIDRITRFGLNGNLPILEKELMLEKDLITLYSLFFKIDFKFDDKEYSEFDPSTLPNIRANIFSNFPDFGYYKTILNIRDLENLEDNGIGDAIDDLQDIIVDLLEIKWRFENNSIDDGLWFFQFTFRTHTQEHVLDLLNYMKQK